MFNVIQNKSFRLDQYTAELLPEGCKIFKCPRFTPGGHIEWSGCYASPNTALAAIKAHAIKKKLSEEKYKELFDMYQGSLARCDAGMPTENLKPNISAAPSPTNLVHFGGNMSFEEYRKLYDPDGIMSKIFTQNIPIAEVSKEDGEISVTGPHNPNCWYTCMIDPDSKCSPENVTQMPYSRDEIPRNMVNVVEYLMEKAATYGVVRQDNAVVLVQDPDKRNMIGLADPNDWNEVLNPLATKVYGKQAVFGPVLYLGKSQLKLKPKKKAQAQKAQVQSKNAATQTTSPTTTTTTTTTTECVKEPAETKAAVKRIRVPSPNSQKTQPVEKKQRC